MYDYVPTTYCTFIFIKILYNIGTSFCHYSRSRKKTRTYVYLLRDIAWIKFFNHKNSKIKILFLFSGLLESRFVCPNRCGRSYKNKPTVRRHLQYECGIEPQFECYICHKKFPYPLKLKLHLGTVHKKIIV